VATGQLAICDPSTGRPRRLTQSARDIAAHAQTHATGTVAEIDRLLQAASTLQAELASRDEQRLTAWRDTLATMAATMRDEWQQASTQSAEHQREIRDALARTASDIATHTQEQANGTIAEVAVLRRSQPRHPRPPPTSSPNCARSSPTAWRATTQCSRSVGVCSKHSARCSMP
jgi:ABC-type transporter Mla subunit MlaD